MVQLCDFRIVGNDKPDLSMEVQADSWSRETERLDQGKFLRAEPFLHCQQSGGSNCLNYRNHRGNGEG